MGQRHVVLHSWREHVMINSSNDIYFPANCAAFCYLIAVALIYLLYFNATNQEKVKKGGHLDPELAYEMLTIRFYTYKCSKCTVLPAKINSDNSAQKN